MKIANCQKDGDWRTKRQWLENGRFPIGEGEEMWTNGFCQHWSEYWKAEQTRPATEEELQQYNDELRQKRRLQAQKRRKRRKAQKEEMQRRIQWEKAHLPERTSWQWLSIHHCAVRSGEKPHHRDNGWWYYYKDQVEPVSDSRYEQLRAKYIDKFGGWEQIDLDHTAYDGRVWY